jgi:exportin-1
LLGLYKFVGGAISEAVAVQGPVATATPLVRALRTLKKEVLKLCDTYIRRADDLQTVVQNIIPNLLPIVLTDYNQNIDPAKDPEVLSTMASIITRLKGSMSPHIPDIFDASFECTMAMIGQDFESYPTHRIGFASLIQAMTSSCFDALLTLSQQQFHWFMMSVRFCCEQPSRDVHEISLSVYADLLKFFAKCDPNISLQFYQTYFTIILTTMFACATSSMYRSGDIHLCRVQDANSDIE